MKSRNVDGLKALFSVSAFLFFLYRVLTVPNQPIETFASQPVILTQITDMTPHPDWRPPTFSPVYVIAVMDANGIQRPTPPCGSVWDTPTVR